MDQSTKIVAAVLFGYLVFTTVNGNLYNWLKVFGMKS